MNENEGAGKPRSPVVSELLAGWPATGAEPTAAGGSWFRYKLHFDPRKKDLEPPMIRLSVSGNEHELDLDPNMPLLWAIREHVGLTGTKYGCHRQAAAQSASPKSG